MEEWITTSEAAKRLGISVSMVCRLLRESRIVGRRGAEPGILGEIWRIDPASVAAFPEQDPTKPGRPRNKNRLKVV